VCGEISPRFDATTEVEVEAMGTCVCSVEAGGDTRGTWLDTYGLGYVGDDARGTWLVVDGCNILCYEILNHIH
jgi:hypothetical protein